VVTDPRKKAILFHIARYQVTLRPVLYRLFPESEKAGIDKAVDALVREKLIAAQRNGVREPEDPQTRYTYYHLTAKGCSVIGAPESRHETPGPEALERSLAILWLCSMTRVPSYRVSSVELAELLVLEHRREESLQRITKHVSGFHCITRREDGTFRIQHLYYSTASPSGTLSELRGRIEKARRVGAVARAIDADEYGFTILVSSPERTKALRQANAKLSHSERLEFNVRCSPRTWRLPDTSHD